MLDKIKAKKEMEELKKEIAILEDEAKQFWEKEREFFKNRMSILDKKEKLAKEFDSLELALAQEDAEEVEVEIRYSVIEEKTEKVKISAVEFLRLNSRHSSDIFFELESRFMKDIKNYQEESFEIEGHCY